MDRDFLDWKKLLPSLLLVALVVLLILTYAPSKPQGRYLNALDVYTGTAAEAAEEWPTMPEGDTLHRDGRTFHPTADTSPEAGAVSDKLRNWLAPLNPSEVRATHTTGDGPVVGFTVVTDDGTTFTIPVDVGDARSPRLLDQD